eukprot:gene12846-19800_t
MDFAEGVPDRGKRRGFSARLGGNVLYNDPRKKALRFGATSESSGGVPTASEKVRIKRHLVTAVQRHIIQKAACGERADLQHLGGLYLRPPTPMARSRPPIRPSPPSDRSTRRSAASIHSSQDLPASAAGSICPPTPLSERVDPTEWEHVMLYKDTEGCVVPNQEAASSRRSHVRSILSRCRDLKREIASERESVNSISTSITDAHQKELISDDDVITSIRHLARTDPVIRERVRKVYEDAQSGSLPQLPGA